MTADEISRLSASAHQSILDLAPGLLQRKPVEGYISLLASTKQESYAQESGAIKAWCDDILHDFGQDGLGTYHRLVLLTLIQGIQGGTKIQYPDSCRILFEKELHAIAGDMQRKPLSKYLYTSSEFRKDLAICRQVLIPCGIVTVEMSSGVPRRYLVQNGVRTALRLAAFMAQKVGSFRPLYEMHLHGRALQEFTAAGWEASFLRIAELMRLDAVSRGVFASSWWYDPKVIELVPRLSFLQSVPRSHGAGIFALASNASTTRDALASSPERKRLYDAGVYKPRPYLMIWGREDFLRWAEKQGQRS